MITNRLLNAVELVKTRRAHHRRRENTLSSRVMKFSLVLLALISVAIAIAAEAALPFYFYLTAEMPAVNKLEQLFNPVNGVLLQPTRLYDSTGQTLVMSLSPEGIQRGFVLESQVPWLAKAFVAGNQPDFWDSGSSNGFDLIDPADSIEERLIANVFFSTDEKSWLTNLRTNILADEVLYRYGKSQVLTWALNSADFGRWAFGAESAAQMYFGKPATDLNLAESALMAAVAQAPALNPHDAPELAISYQRLILTAMREQDLITVTEFDAAIATPLVFTPPRETISDAPDFTTLALEQLEAELGHQRLLLGGLEVTTSLDLELQQNITNIATLDLNWLVADPVNNRLIAVRSVDEIQNSEQTLTPLVYLSAFANGFSPSDNLWGTGNQSLLSEIGPTSFSQALAQRLEFVTDSLLENPGIAEHYAHLLGVAGLSDDRADDPWRIGQMYSLLSQNGLLANQSPTPNTILFAADANGAIEVDHVNSSWQAITSPEITFQTNNILRDTTYWLGFTSSRPAALFQDPKNTWQLSYSPRRVVMIWDKDEIDAAFGSRIFDAAHMNLPMKDWEVPPGLTSITVCVPSGQLPDEDCPQSRREWFVHGSEPAEYDSLFQRFAINSLNGKLATVFTPAEFIQESVYLMVPHEAESWALEAGFPLSPVDYDPIPDHSDLDDNPVRITRPLAFTEVSGVVRIIGTLSEEITGFDIQVGQGLRPTEWLLVTQGSSAPSSNRLAEWDTEGLAGIWAIQLQVWNEDGSVTRAYTVVTVE